MTRNQTIAAMTLGLSLAALPVRAWNGYKAMAKEFSRGARREGVERVAVLPFLPTDASNPNDGWNISERLVTQMVRLGQVRTVERGLLRKVLEEQYLARTGVIDAATLRRLGKILAVDAVVTGSFVTLGSEVSVNARLIEVETGVIVAASERTLPREWWDSGRGLMPAYAEAAPAPAAWTAAAPSVGEEERAELRDAPASPDCVDAATRADEMESSILDLKARYWAQQLKKSKSSSPALATPPGAAISDPDLRSQLFSLVKRYSEAGGAKALSPAEVKRFLAADGAAFRIHHDCGI